MENASRLYMSKRERLHVDRMPLSWREEGPVNEKGYRTKSICVGRRVWGEYKGLAQFYFIADGDMLCLYSCMENTLSGDFENVTLIQRFSDPNYGAHGGDNVHRAVQVAEFHEGQTFNSYEEIFNS